MPKVFISHSWDDNDVARKIAHHVKRDGAEIWIDYARISGGESLPDGISEALEWCDILILVWSKPAAVSYYVKLEWQSALHLQKRIIPCLLDDTKQPAILRGLLYIDFKDFDNGYIKLCRALKLVTKEEELKKQQLKKDRKQREQERLEKQQHETKIQQLESLTKANKLLQRSQQELKQQIAELHEKQPPIIETQAELQKKPQPKPVVTFRSESVELSENEVEKMLKKHGFFDLRKNKKGSGFANRYDLLTIKGDGVIKDFASVLMWQQGGSDKIITFKEAQQFIKDLNKGEGFVGYKDWRLPTLEEAMSLMESTKKNGRLNIDPMFDSTQRWIWTSDFESSGAAWVVDFGNGGCYYDLFDFVNDFFVRAVR